MSITCEVIKDLLPLYHDDVCSEDSRKLIDEHLKNCEKCRQELKNIDVEIKTIENVEDIRVMNGIAKKWRQDKLLAFFTGTLIFSVIASLGCSVAYNMIGSYVAADGILVEPFALIPLGFLFGFIAILSVGVLGIMAIVRRMRKTK